METSSIEKALFHPDRTDAIMTEEEVKAYDGKTSDEIDQEIISTLQEHWAICADKFNSTYSLEKIMFLNSFKLLNSQLANKAEETKT